MLNEHLADSLRRPARATGSTFYLYGTPARLTVRDVVPAEGLAGMGIGAAVNRDAFVTPGTLTAAAAARRTRTGHHHAGVQRRRRRGRRRPGPTR